MALFLSDIHLGHSGCQAERLLAFLQNKQHHVLYLVGDIVDDLSRRWPSSHKEVLSRLLAFPKIIYLPGNHDYLFRVLVGMTGRIAVHNSVVHRTPIGKRYLVCHGDVYDSTLLLSFGPRWLRLMFRSIADIPHTKVIRHRFERKVARAASAYDGVICGHVHRPAQKMIDGVEYLNCGDWLNNCTAVIESGGVFRLVKG